MAQPETVTRGTTPEPTIQVANPISCASCPEIVNSNDGGTIKRQPVPRETAINGMSAANDNDNEPTQPLFTNTQDENEPPGSGPGSCPIAMQPRSSAGHTPNCSRTQVGITTRSSLAETNIVPAGESNPTNTDPGPIGRHSALSVSVGKKQRRSEYHLGRMASSSMDHSQPQVPSSISETD